MNDIDTQSSHRTDYKSMPKTKLEFYLRDEPCSEDLQIKKRSDELDNGFDNK